VVSVLVENKLHNFWFEGLYDLLLVLRGQLAYQGLYNSARVLIKRQVEGLWHYQVLYDASLLLRSLFQHQLDYVVSKRV